MSAPIHWYLHGRGRGHASRSRPVIEALRAEGHRIEVFAGGDALDLMPDATPIPLVPRGVRAVGAMLARIVAARRLLDLGRPALVVSDGDASSIAAAATLRLPSLALGHELVFTRCGFPAGATVRQRLQVQTNAWASTWLSDRRIAVHFLPTQTADATTRVARPALESRWRTPLPTRPAPGDGRLLAYFRDGDGAPALRAALPWAHGIDLFGQASTDVGGVVAHGFDPAGFAERLPVAAGVLCSAGSNLLAECVALGVPVLAFHPRNEAEQALNARAIEAAGVGMAACIEDPPDSIVASFLARVRAADFRRVDLLDALPTVLEVVREEVERALGGKFLGA